MLLSFLAVVMPQRVEREASITVKNKGSPHTDAAANVCPPYPGSGYVLFTLRLIVADYSE